MGTARRFARVNGDGRLRARAFRGSDGGMGDAGQDSDKDRGTPSLAEQLRRRRFRVPARFVPVLRWTLLGAVVLLGVVVIVATVAGQRARREALGLGETVARVSAAREADRTAAALFAAPGMTEELARLAAHLPPDTRLVRAGRDRDGMLSFAIDSADPDSLRQTLKGDAYLQAFRERGQAMGEEGVIRVTFERDPGEHAPGERAP